MPASSTNKTITDISPYHPDFPGFRPYRTSRYADDIARAAERASDTQQRHKKPSGVSKLPSRSKAGSCGSCGSSTPTRSDETECQSIVLSTGRYPLDFVPAPTDAGSASGKLRDSTVRAWTKAHGHRSSGTLPSISPGEDTDTPRYRQLFKASATRSENGDTLRIRGTDAETYLKYDKVFKLEGSLFDASKATQSHVWVKGAPMGTQTRGAMSDAPTVGAQADGAEREEYLISYRAGRGDRGDSICITPGV